MRLFSRTGGAKALILIEERHKLNTSTRNRINRIAILWRRKRTENIKELNIEFIFRLPLDMYFCRLETKTQQIVIKK